MDSVKSQLLQNLQSIKKKREEKKNTQCIYSLGSKIR